MPNAEWIDYIPKQWVGIVALIMCAITITTHLIEKYPTFAKLLPLGTWWHERSKNKQRRSDWIAEDNEVITGLQQQMGRQNEQLALISAQMQELDETVRCFRAWSIYDARYHHRIEVQHAESDNCELPRHYDFFEFERIWRNNPVQAAKLSDFGGTMQ